MMHYSKLIHFFGVVLISSFGISLYFIILHIENTKYQHLILPIGIMCIIIVLVIIYFSMLIKKEIYNEQKNESKLRKHIDTLNEFYKLIQDCDDMKSFAKISIKFISEQSNASSGLIYLASYKNMNLQLLDVYNSDITKENKIIDMYRGVIGEAFATKNIKKYTYKDIVYLAIPLVVYKKVVGVVQLKYYEKNDILNITKENNIIFDIVVNNLVKELEYRKNKEYLDLIDKFVLISSTNTDGDITFVSDAFCSSTGYTKDELIGNSHKIFKHPKVDDNTYKSLWETISSGKIWNKDIANLKKDGSTYWAKTTIIPRFDIYNNIIGYNAIREDITSKKLLEEISITDALTNINNRRYFDEQFPLKIKLSKRIDKKLAFCMIDIDHFKQYNDTYGHQEGDIALQKVAQVLDKSLKRENDFVFRLGGEEFGLLYFVENENDAFDIANKTRISIENQNIIHKNNSASKYLTVSMGLYIYDNGEQTHQEIYQKTDKLLYEAKENGRNQVITNITKEI